MRILVFKKWFTVTKLNRCLIYEDWRTFLKRNNPLSKGTWGNPGRGCSPRRWAKVGRVFLCKANLAAGWEQPVQKEKLISERRLEIPGLGGRFPDPSTSLTPPKPQAHQPQPRWGRLSTSTSRGSHGAGHWEAGSAFWEGLKPRKNITRTMLQYIEYLSQ